MLTFIPFPKTPESYETLAAIRNSVWTDNPTTAEVLKYDDDTMHTGRFFERFFVEDEAGEVVGYGRYCETWWADSEDQYEIDVAVLPDRLEQGIGSQIYAHIMTQLADRAPKSYLADTREDYPRAVRFLEKRGFKLMMRESESELDLTTFDPTPYDDIIQKLAGEGIQLIDVNDYRAREPLWQQKIHALETELDADVPYFEEFVPVPFDEYATRYSRPGYDPAGWWLAIDEATGEPVGMSTLWIQENRSHVNTGMTGVTRPYRRRGIARALKARAIAYAQTTGKSALRTENEENNPMFQLNLQLGFKPIPGWLFFKKEAS